MLESLQGCWTDWLQRPRFKRFHRLRGLNPSNSVHVCVREKDRVRRWGNHSWFNEEEVDQWGWEWARNGPARTKLILVLLPDISLGTPQRLSAPINLSLAGHAWLNPTEITSGWKSGICLNHRQLPVAQPLRAKAHQHLLDKNSFYWKVWKKRSPPFMPVKFSVH